MAADPHVAILATHGVEETELTAPAQALRRAGVRVSVVSPEAGPIRSLHKDEAPGASLEVDLALADAAARDFSMLVLPGGTLNADRLRIDARAVAFVRHFVEAAKPIAAICHGPWILLEADGVSGRAMTSWPSLRTDLRNGGAEWSDEPCVVDRNLVTSRRPGDLPDFNREMLRQLGHAPD